MEPSLSLRNFLAITLVSFAFTASSAHAAEFYWDNNADSAGFGTAGGTWAAPTVSLWSNDPTGVAATEASITTTASDALHFGTLTAGLAAGTITGSGTVSANSLTFGSASGAVTLSGGTLAMGGTTPTITVNNSANTILSILTGTGTLVKRGGGVVTLSGSNTMSGVLDFGIQNQVEDAGTLRLEHSNALGTKNVEFETSGAIELGTSGLTVASNILVGNRTATAPRTLSLDLAGTATGTFSGLIDIRKIDNLTTFNVGTDDTLTLSGNITGAAGWTKTGAGTLQLSGVAKTYSGATIIKAGTLKLVAADLIPDGAFKGNLTVTGTLDLNTFSETINGLSGAGIVDTVAGGAPTLTVGSNDQTSTFSGTIQNTAGTLALAKTGTGTLTLSNTNTYAGATTIGGGTLALGANNVLPDSSSLTIGAATLAAATFDDSLGTLDVSAAATVHLGKGANLVFADSSGVDWTDTPGTLNITGTFVSGSSIKFATSSGLTRAQLDLITINGVPGTYTLDSSGFLSIGNVSSSYEAWQAANSTAQASNLDHDNDGVSNGVEYFLSGNTNTTGFTALPGVNNNNAGVLSVTWTKAATGYTGTYDSDFVVETSSTLANFWTRATTSLIPNIPDTVYISGNSVTYTFPAGTKNFARLAATGGPAGSGDWRKIRLYGHAYNITSGQAAGWTVSQLNTIAGNFQLFTSEKRHAADYYGNNTTEAAVSYASKVFVDRNPNTEVLFYWNSIIPYIGLFESITAAWNAPEDYFEEAFNPAWPGELQFKWSNPAMSDWWINVANSYVNAPGAVAKFAGVFVDGVVKADGVYSNQIKAAMDRLDGLVIYNGYKMLDSRQQIYAGSDFLEHADGVYVEGWGGNMLTASAAGRKLIVDSLLAVSPNKYIICHSFSGNALGTQEFKNDLEDQLAAFLIVANDFSYFHWGDDYGHTSVEGVSMIEEFQHAVGAPVSPVTVYADRYERRFKHCTAIWYPNDPLNSVVLWGQFN